MQNSMPIYADVAEATAHAQQTLKQIPIRSSAIAREIVKVSLPAQETTGEKKHYLLTREEQWVCDMATD